MCQRLGMAPDKVRRLRKPAGGLRGLLRSGLPGVVLPFCEIALCCNRFSLGGCKASGSAGKAELRASSLASSSGRAISATMSSSRLHQERSSAGQ